MHLVPKHEATYSPTYSISIRSANSSCHLPTYLYRRRHVRPTIKYAMVVALKRAVITFTLRTSSSSSGSSSSSSRHLLLARDWLLSFLGQKHCLDVGQHTTLGNGNTTEEFVQLLVVANGQLQMTRDDTRLLVVTCRIAC